MSGREPDPVDVLVVGPTPEGDRPYATAFAGKERETRLHVVGGREARRYLGRCGDRGDVPRPDLVIVDLEVSGADATELLDPLDDRDGFAAVPLIVLGRSDDPAVVERAYDRGANAYVRKPADPGGCVDALRTVGEFWFDVARLPPKELDESGGITRVSDEC
ncbi:response regulator [Natrialbaceae archaeon GCM10025810]|uniref:response regulator n=1 Tax=Halovalidus salilacus TaxID=3075124 RepID=UPI0036180ECE